MRFDRVRCSLCQTPFTLVSHNKASTLMVKRAVWAVRCYHVSPGKEPADCPNLHMAAKDARQMILAQQHAPQTL